jgi:site-specific recombinase XerD
MRAYRGQLADRQAPASVNAALAAVRRFYAWALESGHLERDLTRNLADVERQPLSPKGFSNVERHRLRRTSETMGALPHAAASTCRGCRGLRWREGWVATRRAVLNVDYFRTANIC